MILVPEKGAESGEELKSYMKIHIKNMVCNRCIIAVNDIFKKSGIEPLSVTLGEVEVAGDIENDKVLLIRKALNEIGFEIIEDSKSRIIEKIKNVVIELVHHSDEEPKFNFSEIIESKLHLNYNYLSNLFSSVEGTTIEN